MTQPKAMGSLTTELKPFKKFISAISTISSEARLHINAETLSVLVIDAANVAMVDTELKIIESKLSKGDQAVLGIAPGIIKSCLEAIEKRYPEDNPDLFISWLPGKEAPLLDIETENSDIHFRLGTVPDNEVRRGPNRPTIALPSKFVCSGPLLAWAIKTAGIFHDSCWFDIRKDGICYIAAKDQPPDQIKTRIAQSATEPALANYSLDYLKDITKFWEGTDEVSVELRDDHPVSISGKPLPELSVKFLLAPRIENDPPITEWIE